jgi:hypothetical protein
MIFSGILTRDAQNQRPAVPAAKIAEHIWRRKNQITEVHVLYLSARDVAVHPERNKTTAPPENALAPRNYFLYEPEEYKEKNRYGQ